MRIFDMMSTIVEGHIRHYGLPFVQDTPTEYGTGQSAIAKYAYDVFTNPYGSSKIDNRFLTSQVLKVDPGKIKFSSRIIYSQQTANPTGFDDFLLFFEYLL